MLLGAIALAGHAGLLLERGDPRDVGLDIVVEDRLDVGRDVACASAWPEKAAYGPASWKNCQPSVFSCSAVRR